MSTEPTIHPTPSTIGAPISQDEVGSVDGPELNPAFVRSELTLHWIFLSIAAVILLLSFLMRSEGEKAVFFPGFQTAMPETCTSQRLFGIDCPGCGMTRAFISISSGQFVRAWNFNAASFIVYLFVAFQIPWHTIQIWRLKNRRLPLVTRWAYMAPVAMVVVMAVHWVWKISCQIGS